MAVLADDDVVMHGDALHSRYAVLLPITYTAPFGAILSEHNIDEWPNGGLSPVSGRSGLMRFC